MLLVWPIVVPFFTAVFCVLAAGSAGAQRAISTLGALALIAASVAVLLAVLEAGPVAAQMGGWPAPFGISLVADRLSAGLVVVTGLIGLAVVVYGFADFTATEERFGQHALTHALLAGLCGAFLTGDLFNMYVWFEVMLIASFGLLVVGGRREQLDGGVKYVGLNLIATLAFLTGVGLLYGATGALNMADLHEKLAGRQGETAVLGAAALLLFAFGAKAALFPVFFWLPAAYPTPAFATSALFAALLTKVGVYSLYRVFTLVFDVEEPAVRTVLLAVALATMVVGAAGALVQTGIRRIFSFTVVSSIGYMVLGLAIHTPLAVAAGVFYLFQDIVAKAGIFLYGGIIRRLTGSEELERTGGIWAARPWLAALFLIPAFSLGGIPPLAGFWAKLLIVQATIADGRWLETGLALAAGLVMLWAVTRVWLASFWAGHPERDEAALAAPVPAAMLVPVLLLAAATAAIGIWAGPFVGFALAIGAEILDPAAYVAAVLGGER